jgi:RNA polymerase sigma-70 factor (ECF subfamily)
MTVMDSQWLAKCRGGDSLAIERMVQTHQQDVYRLALSILDDHDEADDVTQEVFISALRGLDSFHGRRSYLLIEADCLRAWICHGLRGR